MGEWRVPDEGAWRLTGEPDVAAGAGADPRGGVHRCYGCGAVGEDAGQGWVRLDYRRGADRLDVHLCEVCWAAVAVEPGSTLADLWEWLPVPRCRRHEGGTPGGLA